MIDSPHSLLRRQTTTLHEQLDSVMTALPLATHEGFGRFLRALLPIEAVETWLTQAGAERHLADWPARRRGAFLRADLAALDAGGPAPDWVPPCPPQKASEAHVFGALYVLEGSKLGARVLQKLPDEKGGELFRASRFITQSVSGPSWANFLKSLENSHYTRQYPEEAVLAAESVFGGLLVASAAA